MDTKPMLPVVDLNALPVEFQVVEYRYRLERGKSHPNAVKVRFHMNGTARAVADSDWYSGAFFLAS